MFKFKRLDHIGLATADSERFLDFYCGILGFEVRERWTVKGMDEAIAYPPIVIMFFLMQKHFIAGLTLGANKE